MSVCNMKREDFQICKNVNKLVHFFCETFSLLTCGIFRRRTTYKCFLRYIIYWIADRYTSTQATCVMLLIKLELHLRSAMIILSSTQNIYIYYLKIKKLFLIFMLLYFLLSRKGIYFH